MIKKNYPILLVILVLFVVGLLTKTTFLNRKSSQITLPTPTIAPIPGCLSDTDCPAGTTCQEVQCITAPCYNQCLADSKPRMEKLPWENSTCGNNVCELCESSDSCCNYPPVKDKNGTLMYPPPTCMGQCPSDCTNEIKSGK